MFDIVNPATGSLIAQVQETSPADIAAAYRRARAAQPDWARVPLSQRALCLRRFRELLVNQSETLAQTLTSEVGKPIRQARNELNGVLARIDFFLDQAEAALRTETVFEQDGMQEQISHEPLGVIANISAWNYPYFVGANVIVPALLTGNSVLYKPSEFASLTGQHIGRLLHQAGVPADVFIVVTGAGAAGAALLAQPIDGLFFTGSVATGKRIAAALQGRLVKLQLELGGKDPIYVCDDASPVAAADSLADGAMYNTGQSCCSVERIYVHAAIYDDFVAAFVATVRGLVIGDPTDDSTYIGPLSRAAQLPVLEAQIADAVARGARIVCGGKRLPGPGNWFEPTVLVDVDHSMAVMREESFGPIIGIQRVANDEAALALMNDSHYGLTAGIYSSDEARARRLMARLNAGSVYWNCCDRVSPRLPWSGVGDSGIGLTLSVYGIQTFTRPKAWHLRR